MRKDVLCELKIVMSNENSEDAKDGLGVAPSCSSYQVHSPILDPFSIGAGVAIEGSWVLCYGAVRNGILGIEQGCNGIDDGRRKVDPSLPDLDRCRLGTALSQESGGEPTEAQQLLDGLRFTANLPETGERVDENSSLLVNMLWDICQSEISCLARLVSACGVAGILTICTLWR